MSAEIATAAESPGRPSAVCENAVFVTEVGR